jgi:hypothetical protein
MALTRPRAYQIYDIDYKQAVRVVAVTNVTLAGGAPNSVDGVNLSVNDRVLVTAQTGSVQNGIYYVTVLGTGANGTWTRSIDTDTTGELLSGTIVMVTEGLIYADTQWKLITNDPITIGVTALAFVQNYLANSISYGQTSFTIGSSNANATISVAGTSNVAVFSTSGANITGNLISGNVSTTNVFATNGTFTNNVIVSGTLTATSNIIANTSGIFYGNVTTGNTALYAGVPGFTPLGSNVVIQAAGNVNSYSQINFENINSGSEASTDYIATADNGNDSTNFVNLGIGSSTYAPAAYPAFRANDAYLLNNGGNLLLNAQTAGKLIKFLVGGSANTNVIATLSSTTLAMTGAITASGNITGSYILGNGSQLTGLPATYANSNVAAYLASGTVSTNIITTANVTSGNLTTTGLVSATGNVTSSGNVSGTYLLGNVFYATGFSASKIYNGTSEVNIGTSGGAANISIGGTSNVVVVSSTGVAIIGDLSVTGNATLSGNILGDRLQNGTTSIDIQTASGNANISVAGTSNVVVFSSTGQNIAGYLTSSGNITGGNLNTSGIVSVTGNINTSGALNINSTDGNYNVLNISGTALGPYGSPQTWKFFTNNVALGGSPSFIVFPDSSTQTTAYPGTTSTLSLSANISGGNLISNAAVIASGNITGSYILGNGRNLTGINTFSSIAVTGSDTITANSIATGLTFTGDTSIVVTANTTTNTVSFAFGGSGESIFSTGGQMGLVTELVVNSEDLGLVTEVPVAEEYELGTLFLDGFVGNPNFLPNSINGNILVADAIISTTGNITAGNLISTGLANVTGNITGGNLVTAGAVYSNFNTNTANTASFNATGGNTKGGTGYLDFLVAQNTSGGATNPFKWFRTNITGGLEIINSAYNNLLLSLTDAGALSVASSISVAGKKAVNGPAFRASIAVGQTITSGTQQKVTFGTETFDTDGNFASSRFTPTTEGYYQLNSTVRIAGGSSTGEYMLVIWKNGSEYSRGSNGSGTEIGASFYSMQVSDIAYANGSTDYFEIYIQQTSGSNKDTTAGAQISYFSGCMIRGA